MNNENRAAGYNDSQWAAICSTAPVTVVSAGPGSGKSHTIVGRILHGSGSLERTAVITFTTSAARVLRERLAEHGATVGFAGTIHSFCLSLLRRYHDLVGYGPKISVLDEDSATALLKRTIKAQRYTGTIEAAKNALKAFIQTNPKKPEELVAAAVWRQMRASNAVDFDGLLLLGCKLLIQPKVLMEWKYLDLAWDEMQDASDIFYYIFKAIPAKRKFAVGDACQSIMGFLKADVRIILDAMKNGAACFRLEDNFRCPVSVCRLADKLIAHNGVSDRTVSATGREGHIAVHAAATARDEAKWIANRIHEFDEMPQPPDGPSSIAVLLRSNQQRIEMSNLLEGFGVRVEKKETTEQIMDWGKTKALLNALSDPDNEMFAEALIRLWKPDEADAIISSAVASLQSLNDACLHLPTCQSARQAIDYIASKKPSEAALARLNAALKLLPETASIADLQIALSEQQDTGRTTIPGVRVCTLHSSKGQEFDVVFMPAMEEGFFPSDADAKTPESEQESRRLCYVGVTRSSDYLFLSYAAKRKPLFHGREQPTKPSRFLFEMGVLK